MFDVGCSMLFLTIAQSLRIRIQIFLTHFHFRPNRPLKSFAEKEIRHNAPARYTLPAWKEKNQINQAQFRSKSGALSTEDAMENKAGNSRTGDSGRDQETAAGAISETWF